MARPIAAPTTMSRSAAAIVARAYSNLQSTCGRPAVSPADAQRAAPAEPCTSRGPAQQTAGTAGMHAARNSAQQPPVAFAARPAEVFVAPQPLREAGAGAHIMHGVGAAAPSGVGFEPRALPAHMKARMAESQRNAVIDLTGGYPVARGQAGAPLLSASACAHRITHDVPGTE